MALPSLRLPSPPHPHSKFFSPSTKTSLPSSLFFNHHNRGIQSISFVFNPRFTSLTTRASSSPTAAAATEEETEESEVEISDRRRLIALLRIYRGLVPPRTADPSLRSTGLCSVLRKKKEVVFVLTDPTHMKIRIGCCISQEALNLHLQHRIDFIFMDWQWERTSGLLQNCDLPPPLKLEKKITAPKITIWHAELEPVKQTENTSLTRALQLSQSRAREEEEKAAAVTATNEQMAALLLEESLRLSAFRVFSPLRN